MFSVLLLFILKMHVKKKTEVIFIKWIYFNLRGLRYVTLGLIFSQLCCDLFKFTRIMLLRKLRVIFSQLCFDLFKFTRIILLRKLRVIFRFLVNFA